MKGVNIFSTGVILSKNICEHRVTSVRTCSLIHVISIVLLKMMKTYNVNVNAEEKGIQIDLSQNSNPKE